MYNEKSQIHFALNLKKDTMRHLFLSTRTILISFFICSIISTNTKSNATNNTTSIESQHFQLKLQKLPLFKLYDDSPIVFKSRNAYQEVINRWQKKLNKGAEKLFNQLYLELNITPEQIYEQFDNQKLIDNYHRLTEAEIACQSSKQFISEEDADPEVISFIRNVLQRYCTKENITIILTDAISCMTTTYGSDLQQHYLFCHMHMYTAENIKKYYNSINGGPKVFCVEQLKNNSVRWIDLSNILMLGLIEASSSIEHQTDFFTFLLQHCNCRGKQASAQTIRLSCQLHEFFVLLEAIFQSTNPLEAALFFLKSPHRSQADKKMWKILVKDIAQSYSTQSLEQFKLYAQQFKEESL